MTDRQLELYQVDFNKLKPENPANCIKSVHNQIGWFYHQCIRKRGYGKDGLYCKTHAKSGNGSK